MFSLCTSLNKTKTIRGFSQKRVPRCPTKNLGPIGSAVLTFIGYKQTDRQTDRQAKFIYIDSQVIFMICNHSHVRFRICNHSQVRFRICNHSHVRFRRCNHSQVRFKYVIIHKADLEDIIHKADLNM